MRRARRANSLTQETCAARCGIGYKRLQAIEAGEVNATFATLAKIADGIGITVWQLLGV